VVVGLGCSAFAPSSYGSGGVSELLESVFVPDAAAIPVVDTAAIPVDSSITTPEFEARPDGQEQSTTKTVPEVAERGPLFASSPTSRPPQPSPCRPTSFEGQYTSAALADRVALPLPGAPADLCLAIHPGVQG